MPSYDIYLTSNQTWTVPAGVSSLWIGCVGGGGGGGGCNGYAGNPTCGDGGGGGSGGYSAWTISVSPGQQFSVTIGYRGNANEGCGNSGQTGGSTYFGGYGVGGGGGGSGGNGSRGGGGGTWGYGVGGTGAGMYDKAYGFCSGGVGTSGCVRLQYTVIPKNPHGPTQPMTGIFHY